METVSLVLSHHFLHGKQVLFFRVHTDTSWTRRLIHVYVTVCHHFLKRFLFEEFSDGNCNGPWKNYINKNLFWSIERYVVWKHTTSCEAGSPFLSMEHYLYIILWLGEFGNYQKVPAQPEKQTKLSKANCERLKISKKPLKFCTTWRWTRFLLRKIAPSSSKMS